MCWTHDYAVTYAKHGHGFSYEKALTTKRGINSALYGAKAGLLRTR